jgi:predicted nucleic acid-binding protein
LQSLSGFDRGSDLLPAAAVVGDYARDSLVVIRLDGEPIEGALLELARRHQLTVYDAAYLELAQRKNFSLATLDRALASAARAEGVSLIGD